MVLELQISRLGNAQARIVGKNPKTVTYITGSTDYAIWSPIKQSVTAIRRGRFGYLWRVIIDANDLRRNCIPN